MKDGKQWRIDGDEQPFGVHEVRYKDAKYFMSSRDGYEVSAKI